MKCNRDCFNCPYQDCIVDSISDKEKTESYKRDAVIRVVNNNQSMDKWLKEQERKKAYYLGLRVAERPPRRRVRQLSKSGAEIRIFESIHDAAMAVGVKQSALIQMVCAGKGKHKTAYGYRWEYADE